MRGGTNIVTPLDQFIVQNPDDFFGSSSAHAHIQLDNLEILVNHLKCAAFELPISPDEQFGNVDLPAPCEELGKRDSCAKAEGTSSSSIRRAKTGESLGRSIFLPCLSFFEVWGR